MIANNVTYALMPVFLYVFCFVFEMKISGIALARGLSEGIAFFMVFHTLRTNPKFTKSFKGYEPRALKDWKKYLKIAIPIGSILYMTWGFNEFMTIFIGTLHDTAALAGHVSFMNIVILFFVFPLGLSFTSNAFMGNLAG